MNEEGAGTADTEGERREAELFERRDAALANVVKFGDPVLKSVASPVAEFGPELRAEAERMVAIMRDSLGVGLAATQIGLLRRLLVFQAGGDNEPTGLVNPQVEWLSDETVVAEEGCLSLPRVAMDVERPLHARISGRDVDGEPATIEGSGLEARGAPAAEGACGAARGTTEASGLGARGPQPNIAHLDAVLTLDRPPRDQRKAALR